MPFFFIKCLQVQFLYLLLQHQKERNKTKDSKVSDFLVNLFSSFICQLINSTNKKKKEL